MVPTAGHAGGFGWDEAIVFAVPLVVLVVLQLVARRRAARQEAEEPGERDRA